MESISRQEMDSITEFINIGMGKAAKILNTMLDSHIELSIAKIEILTEQDIDNSIGNDNQTEQSIVEMKFSGEIKGTASLLFPKASALDLVQALTGDQIETSDLDAIRVGTLSEIGNIVINSLMGMISNILKMNLHYTIPIHREGDLSNLFRSAIRKSPEEKIFIKIINSFHIRNLSIEGNIVLLLSMNSFQRLKDLISEYIEGLQ